MWASVGAAQRGASAPGACSLHLSKLMPSLFTEEGLAALVLALGHVVEAAGALVIFIGALIAIVRFVPNAFARRGSGAFLRIRLELGRYLTLALEFQLASDVLRTAVAPTFEEIGKLAAIATIRTALNYFLALEIKEGRTELAHGDDEHAPHR